MSFCRNNATDCDLYCYQHVNGLFVTHTWGMTGEYAYPRRFIDASLEDFLFRVIYLRDAAGAKVPEWVIESIKDDDGLFGPGSPDAASESAFMPDCSEEMKS